MNTIFDNFTGEVNLSIFRPSSDVPGVNLRRQYLSLVGLLQYVDIINGDLTGNLPDNITEQTVKGMISHCIGDLKVREEMSTEQPEPEIPDDEIWYTSSDGNIIEPNPDTSFGANIISNTYEGDKGIIKFDGPVTVIGESAFDGCKELTSITIPDSVTEIGEWVFDECTGLTSITIPNSVTVIGEGAFYSCTGLTSITIPSGVAEIGDCAFDTCTGLTSIIVDPNNTTYDSRDNCNAIIETTNNMLIQGCKNTTIPDSVTVIGGSAFSYCTGLISITIPDSVTSIGSYAFESCEGLTSITIPDSVNEIGEVAFKGCTGLTSITIPHGVTEIGLRTFQGCDSLTSIVIPDSVTSIGNAVFQNCTGLTSVVIGSGVTSIGNEAFEFCTGLTSITIPDSVTEIGYEAFHGCSSLISITCLNTTPPTLSNSAFDSIDKNYIIYVPTGSVDAYKEAWVDRADHIQAIAE